MLCLVSTKDIIMYRFDDQFVQEEEQAEQFETHDGEEKVVEDDLRALGDRLLDILHVVRRFGENDGECRRRQRRSNVLIVGEKQTVDVDGERGNVDASEIRFFALQRCRFVDHLRHGEIHRQALRQDLSGFRERLGEIQLLQRVEFFLMRVA